MQQKEIRLPKFERGFHLITDLIERELTTLPKIGLVNILIKHTSAAIIINENADYSVRVDFESFVNKLVPENFQGFTHIFEGDDDMPAHIKASIFGQTLTIPITNGKLNLGTWQGIYLCEFRNNGGARRLVLTVYE
ncbi:MAG TPA: secondary thiamine-phosphate synthase [Bacteroidales bacterium]|nr:MAG: secondary thiamine-phosphate synthase [Bacteroidetes bacterium GWF2_33_38]OFY91941.1 MAG: secondary thiamine-phosphate synthase [Bacteroidetes bacterium RIFOXYA2_FULL_33_7]HBF87036.1 secondary thiamine-phosphate synthase [Bacteroidales bacterium]